jgi:hypothetical protein
MVESVPGAVLRELTRSLEAVESQLSSEALPRDTLEDFKMAVDHIRISTWAILSADNIRPGKAGGRSVVAQFRLARVNEMYRHVREDLEGGLIPAGSEELAEFQTIARDLADLAGQYLGAEV